MKDKTVIEIIESWLDFFNYDGLYLPDECACLKSDLGPCGDIQNECTAGYKQDAPEDCPCDWHIGSKNSDNSCGECSGG